MERDLLGGELSAAERGLLAAYRDLEALRRADLPPAARANLDEALASLWQALNDLCVLDEDPPSDAPLE